MPDDNGANCAALRETAFVLYASLKALHLIGVVVWVGGMFFMLMCLRPAAAEALEPAPRVRLLHAALRRFFAWVSVAALLVLASGAGMIALVSRDRAAAGLPFNMPLDWYAMVGIFFVMLAVFAHVRLKLFPQVGRAMDGQAWPSAAKALGAIRWEVMANLVLGLFVIVMVRLGAAA